MQVRVEVYDSFGNLLENEIIEDQLEFQTASRMLSLADWYSMRHDNVYFIAYKALTYSVKNENQEVVDIIGKFENNEIWLSYYYVKYVKAKFGRILKDTILMYKPTKENDEVLH